MKFQLEIFNEEANRVEYWEYEVDEGFEYTEYFSGRKMVVTVVYEDTGLILACENGDADYEEGVIESDLTRYLEPVAKYDAYGHEFASERVSS